MGNNIIYPDFKAKKLPITQKGMTNGNIKHRLNSIQSIQEKSPSQESCYQKGSNEEVRHKEDSSRSFRKQDSEDTVMILFVLGAIAGFFIRHFSSGLINTAKKVEKAVNEKLEN